MTLSKSPESIERPITYICTNNNCNELGSKRPDRKNIEIISVRLGDPIPQSIRCTTCGHDMKPKPVKIRSITRLFT